MRIIGPPSVDRTTMAQSPVLADSHLRFGAQIAPALWDECVALGIDPVGAIAQSYKETGGGTFRGKVTPEHYNTGGIKVRHLGYGGPSTLGDEQLAHAAFASWTIGARAHAQHLAAYAGATLLDRDIVDPRYWLVDRSKWIETFEELGGKWAPSPTYGTELVAIARRLGYPR